MFISTRVFIHFIGILSGKSTLCLFLCPSPTQSSFLYLSNLSLIAFKYHLRADDSQRYHLQALPTLDLQENTKCTPQI